ncbi:uncharacterized protein MELLADRAFT_96465 [Melampsora larici-populina 98AG31]|uniref:Uncharacterized protein n=1 Tax=Melampsora larici-populina (strain 98AG31 / pathotype 3-4-7) TaxID=747676 RepID=F4REY2_MELLP|nr:uncharacterized protein MELLADRAFT_96465 [Melampsora larici-populina 98AG31]EGG09207.1 hypothetical protein MELLADRAFT_96465 [Melampsora larici-populina 98AG31]
MDVGHYYMFSGLSQFGNSISSGALRRHNHWKRCRRNLGRDDYHQFTFRRRRKIDNIGSDSPRSSSGDRFSIQKVPSQPQTFKATSTHGETDLVGRDNSPISEGLEGARKKSSKALGISTQSLGKSRKSLEVTGHVQYKNSHQISASGKDTHQICRTQDNLQLIGKAQEKLQLEGERQEVTAFVPTRRSAATTLKILGHYVQNYYHTEQEYRDPFMRLSIIAFFNNILITNQPQRRQFEQLIVKAQLHTPIPSSEMRDQRLATPHAELSIDADHNKANIAEEVSTGESNDDASVTQTKPATDIEIISNPDPALTRSEKLEFLNSDRKNPLEEIVEEEEPRVEGAKESSDSENSASITVFKKTFPSWFPMSRIEGRRGAKQHHQNINYDKMLHLKKPTKAGLLSDDIAHRLPISINKEHSESTGSAKILDPVEVSEIVEELKRSKAEATNYIINQLESRKSAYSISKFIGPYKIKRIESSIAQQIQAVDVIYWLAYRGEPEAQKVLESKLASGGLEESVETRIKQALELLAENNKIRQSLLSDFADAGPPISTKDQLINRLVTRINRGFSLSAAFGQALDVGKSLTVQGLCRLFAPATNRICRTVSTELSRKLGVDPFRRSSTFSTGMKSLHLYDFAPFPGEGTRRTPTST